MSGIGRDRPAGKENLYFRRKVKTKHGMRQFKTYKSPIFDDNEQLIGTVGIAHDVTDLENMGAELEVILRNLPFAVLLTNEAGKIINANDNLLAVFYRRKRSYDRAGVSAVEAAEFS